MASSHGEQRGPYSFLPTHLKPQALDNYHRKSGFIRDVSCTGWPVGGSPVLMFNYRRDSKASFSTECLGGGTQSECDFGLLQLMRDTVRKLKIAFTF